METLGVRIASARRKKGMSQSQLARAIGVSNNTISNIERDLQDTSVQKLVKIAYHTKADIHWLVTGTTCEEMVNGPTRQETQPVVMEKHSNYLVEKSLEINEKLLELSAHHRATIEELLDLYYKVDCGE